ncbi:helix-turn-helix domain-containing protein [Chitinophaga nivalis]|uniref:AraC family transcriptional regulator n=1 Tax=Chitinophaga nivalis TaxID=2991709 RepID=A0ABT3IR04_9BACT|nr:AraC family transcriptional regulator [Chitinophaga nivalis]MCW3463921.1 AraC family transcriptional regulator [Chitinophaga nivalis]MCW3486389.1 AraC family transcriptional regulator [Chitinophaga nivalis]
MIIPSPVQFEKGTYVGKKVRERHFSHIITSETVFEAHQSSDWHYHVNPHFSHILEGGSKELRKGNSGRQYAGTGLYYHPGEAHQNVDYLPGTRIFNIELGEAFFNRYEVAPPPASLMFEQHHQLNTGGIIRIMREHYLQDNASPLAIDQLCIDLLHPEQETFRCCPEWAAKIKAILYDNWRDPLSLPELAVQLNLHPVTISRYFSKYFGCSAGAYLRRIKIERAIALIRQGRFTLTEIAYECGFTDQAHFTKTFYRMTGWLPRQYRHI